MTKRFLLTTLALVLVMGAGTALVVTSGDDTDEKGPSAKEPGLPAVPGPGSLGLLDEPTWTSEDFPAPGADGVDLLAAVTLVYGPAAVEVREQRTGEVRWTLTRGTDLSEGARWRPSAGNRPRLVGAGQDVTVLTEYRRPTGDGLVEDGLAMLSASDGQVLWLAPLTPPHPPSAGPVAALVLADDQVAVATVGQEVVVVNLAAGARLWTGRVGVPTMIADDTLLSMSGGRMTTVNLLTGAPSWTLDHAKAEPVAAVADVVVVHGDAELVVLDAATGQRLVDIGDPADPHCVSDDDSIACAAAGRVDVFNVWDGTVREVEVDGHLDAVMRDRLFLTSDDRHYTVDFDGETLDETLPGAVVTVDVSQLVVTDGEVFSGYRVST